MWGLQARVLGLWLGHWLGGTLNPSACGYRWGNRQFGLDLSTRWQPNTALMPLGILVLCHNNSHQKLSTILPAALARDSMACPVALHGMYLFNKIDAAFLYAPQLSRDICMSYDAGFCTTQWVSITCSIKSLSRSGIHKYLVGSRLLGAHTSSAMAAGFL